MEKRLIETLLEISEKMNEMEDIDILLSSIISIANEYLDTTRVSVMLEEDGVLVLRAYIGFTPTVKRINMGDGVVGQVAVTGKEVLVNGGSENEKDEYRGASSFLCLPMITSGRVVGVLSLTNKPDDFFNYDDIAIGRYIAGQCALAVERYTLYKEKRISENLQIIGTLKSSVAHDIANLLGVVEVYLELLQDEVPNNTLALEYIDDIFTEIKRVNGLATDMLDFSKNKLSLNKTKFWVGELVEELKRHNRLLIKDTDITIEYRLKDAFQVVADRNRLFRVLFNLINNAIDALGSKGRIVFKVKRVADKAIFIVMDSGKGINKDDIKHLFSPFYTSGKVKGTGLGLAVVSEIVKAHNGDVKVRSELGSYTSFIIRIPINE